MKPLDPGAMRDRITIQRATTTTTGGLTTETWNNLVTTWARVKYQSGNEFLSASTIVGAHQAVFSIRHRTDINQADRILFAGKTWSIVAVLPVGHKVGLDLHARAVS